MLGIRLAGEFLVSSAGRALALGFWVLVVALTFPLLGLQPVLATSPVPAASPTVNAVPSAAPSVNPFRGSTPPSAATQQGRSAAPPAVAPRDPSSQAPVPPGGSSAGQVTGSPAASPDALSGGSPAARPGQSSLSTPRASPGPGAVDAGGTPATFCPELSLTPLAGCQSLPAPIKSMGLASSGTPVQIALVGLFLIAGGWLVYRRSRKPASGRSQEEPAHPPADGPQ
jgi:hypothetical protein